MQDITRDGYTGPSSYLAERARRIQAEREYWSGSEIRGPIAPPVEVTELELVRCAMRTVKLGMKDSRMWDETQKRYRRLVDYGILERAVEIMRRYEELLSKEPMVQQIANDWKKAGAFNEGPEGIV